MHDTIPPNTFNSSAASRPLSSQAASQTHSFSHLADFATADQALNPSWPQPPRQRYALEPIRSSLAASPGSQTLSNSFSENSAIPAHSVAQRHPSQSRLWQPQTITNNELTMRDVIMIDRDITWRERADGQDEEIRLNPLAFYQPHQRHPSSQQPRTATQQTSSARQTSTSSSNSSSSSRESQHKVYLLNCKHCGNFLSDRGMKAVLLLKPNITLYSTDIVPTTCGPFFAPSLFHGGLDSCEPPVERTCDCLTQSLGCYGCGAQVGYNIVSPCARCTSSVMKHQRSSNGHRTVLHCSEITVRERRYVPGEPGVKASPPLVITPSPRLLPPQRSFPPYDQFRRQELSRNYALSQRDSFVYETDAGADYAAYEDEEFEADKADAALASYQQHQLQQAEAHARASSSFTTGSHSADGRKRPRIVRRGDVIYWSDLVAGGERAEPFDPDPILDLPLTGR